MFKNYITTALRNIARNKVFSAINLIGFSIGIVVFIFIMLFVEKEYAYNKFNEKIDQIYRMEYGKGRGVHMTSAMGPDLSDEFPEIKQYSRYLPLGNGYAKYRDKLHEIEGMFLMDSSFFNIFTIKFIQGNPKTALENLNSIVITQSLSKRIFKDENPMGKILRATNGFEYTVNGVIEDLGDFYLQVQAIGPFRLLGETQGAEYLRSYGTYQFPTYFLLEKGTDVANLEQKAEQYFKNRFGDDRDENNDFTVHLRPLEEVYFANETQNDFGAIHGSKKNVLVFIAVGIFILLLACINFINLTTAKAISRAKEVGIRKAQGAKKRQLIYQFISESVLITLFSFLVAITLFQLFLPAYNSIIQAKFTNQVLLQPGYLILSLAGIIVLGVLAGAYPAFYLSSFNAAKVLKGEKTKGKGAAGFRKILVVLQFTISVGLIISTITVNKQLDYMKNKNLGFNKEHILTFRLGQSTRSKREAFRQRIEKLPNVSKAAYSFSVAERGNNFENFDFDGDGNNTNVNVITIDPNYIPLMEMELIEGKNFSWDRQAEYQKAVILNESALKASGLEKGEAAGTIFHRQGWYLTALPSKECKVIGVVKDFHFRSMRTPISPMIFVWNNEWNGYINIKLQPDQLPESIEKIEAIWHEFEGDLPFNYRFLSEEFNRLYQTEERLNTIFKYFSLLAIVIAIMGLYGMSTFIAESRTKEIGIRKALGSTSMKVVLLISKEFLIWVLIAIVIASPIAYYGMNQWLQNFAYKIQWSADIFIMAALISLAIAALTISFKAFRAANTNPAESLRYE